MIMQEKRETEERRREEELQRIQEENDKRREHDFIRRTEEMRLQLESGIEEKWRKQNKRVEEEVAVAKAKAEEAKQKAKEARSKAEEARRRNTVRINTPGRSMKKRGRSPSLTSSSESEDDTSEDSKTDTTDSEEQLRRAIRRIKKKKKARKERRKARGKKPVTTEKKNTTTERGESSRARQKSRCNYEEGNDALRNANDIGAGFEEDRNVRDFCRSPTGRGLNFEGGRTEAEEPKTPMENGYKGLAVKCSREGIIDYCLSTQKILSLKKAFLLRNMCQKKGIRYTKKPEIIDMLAREQVMQAYKGFEESEGHDADSEQAEVKLGDDVPGPTNRDSKQETRSSGKSGDLVGDVDRVITSTTVLLAMRGQIPWLRKYMARSPEMLDLKQPGVYVIANPCSKKTYVGSTVRPMMQRWREHMTIARSEAIGNSPKLYRWIRRSGLGNFVIIPLRHANEADDRAFEMHLIRDFSPSLNTCNTRGQELGIRSRKRKGRRERKRLRQGSATVSIPVSFKQAGCKTARTSILTWLEEEWRKDAKAQRKVVFQNSEIWTDGWKKIKNLFGMTKIRIDGRQMEFARAKGELQKGTVCTLLGITRTPTTTSKRLQELRGMLKKPFQFKGLAAHSTNRLVGLYRAAGFFGDKKTKNDLRLKIDRAIRKKTMVGIRKRVQVKVLYDRRIVKRRIRETTEGVVTKCVADQAKANLIKSRIRDVSCGSAAWEDATVAQWARRFRGLVLAPIDRNQGDTAVVCPVLYRHAFGKMFSWNTDYAQVPYDEKVVMRQARQDFEDEGLQKAAEWKTNGRIGKAYVIPKAKDLTRWRPIAPATNDPAGLAQRRVGRCLHYLMKQFPTEQSFFLNSIQELPQRLLTATKRLTTEQCEGAEGRCYDIKDMFTRISHNAVRKAVRELLSWYANRGCKQVKVSRRGKMCTLSKTRRTTDGYVDMMYKLVNYDLEHAFITCRDEIRRQVSGIPMGKSTSPILVTISCAMAEYHFLAGLGTDRRLVAGWRIVDDITVIVGKRQSEDSKHCRDVFRTFESSYNSNLHLVRKDDSKDYWHFLGGTVYLLEGPLSVLYVPKTKNLVSLRKEAKLTYQTMQDYSSYSEKKTKKSALAGTLKKLWSSTSSQALVIGSIAYALWEANLRGYVPEVSLGALAKLVKVVEDTMLLCLLKALKNMQEISSRLREKHGVG
ncbi:hypothetical protein CBR_g31930 [Chara braunii]|uniref:GIY-YIG domain-containing protein n=1 Tax=Chara braunii TaxID=69332 RepID=A0A388LG31_CHABU|nr:hypothetical protein CBR_g31930 [Chara braunii]|eukprot:GBG81258.1 hypothetical protein CBR_g31930 [Chara braunii]